MRKMITSAVFCIFLVFVDSLRLRRSDLHIANDDFQKETTTSNPYTYSVTSNIISDLPFTPTPSYYSPTPLYSPSVPYTYPTIPSKKKEATTKVLVKSLPFRNPYIATPE